MKVLHLTTAAALVALLAGAAILIARPAQANPTYAAQTGKACTFCHSAPPNLNANGKKFQANGHKLK